MRSDGDYADAVEIKVGNHNYTTLYDPSRYTSMWVAYELEASHMGSLGALSKWYYNPAIDTSLQVNICDSSYNGYSRGHLIPKASRDAESTMLKETYYVTNSVPQIQNSFNSGVWSSLENALQSRAQSQKLYIVTGVAFNKVGETKSITYTTAKDDTTKSIPVPNYFYKVVLRVTTNSSGTVTSASTIGFWFEHKTYTDSYTNYAVSVDQIEAWTGFDFFVNLPDSIEAGAEMNSSWASF